MPDAMPRQSTRSQRPGPAGGASPQKGCPVPLPPPAPRKHLHTRKVEFRGYHREDGMWDIEAQMSDVKTYVWRSHERGQLQPGDPIHDMTIRATVDDDMVIRDIATSMDGTPFGACVKAEDPMRRMIGLRMGPGWRFAIEKALGGVAGCAHLRELLFNMATAAYQTIPGYRSQMRREAGLPVREDESTPPFHLGKCMTWDFNGPQVAQIYPKFVGWQPVKRATRQPG